MVLKNVNDRMQLLYGMEYGIKVFSQIDQGTRVEMRIPREKRMRRLWQPESFLRKSFCRNRKKTQRTQQERKVEKVKKKNRILVLGTDIFPC